jgi:hypothetical protein
MVGFIVAGIKGLVYGFICNRLSIVGTGGTL